MTSEPTDPSQHPSPDAIVAYVLREPLSEEILADLIMHSNMFCVPCGRIIATVVCLARHGRCHRQELVQFARTLFSVVSDDTGSSLA